MALTAMSVLLALTLAFVSIGYAQETSQPDPVDIKGSGKELAATIRDLTARAKDGIPAVQLEKEVLQIQNTASDLLAALPENATDCEIQSVVKTAAAGVGSHEVLKLLTANDAMAVLDGRLALSLAVLDQMAQQLGDELTLSEDVGSILAAIVFATKTTVDIVETADATVNEVLYQPQGGSDDSADKTKDDNGDDVKGRRGLWWPPPIWARKRETRSVWPPRNPKPWDPWPKPDFPGPWLRKRESRSVRPLPVSPRDSALKAPGSKQSHGPSGLTDPRPKVPGSRGPWSKTRGRRQSWDLGGGWNVGLGGLNWQSSSGNANFNVKPTFGGGGLGVSAGFSFRF